MWTAKYWATADRDVGLKVDVSGMICLLEGDTFIPIKGTQTAPPRAEDVVPVEGGDPVLIPDRVYDLVGVPPKHRVEFTKLFCAVSIDDAATIVDSWKLG